MSSKGQIAHELRESGLSWAEVAQIVGCTTDVARKRGWRWVNQEQDRANKRRLYHANPDAHKARAALWRRDNPDRRAEYMRDYYRKNPHYMRDYYRKNPDYWRAYNRARWSREKFGPEWGSVHRALCDLRAAIKERTDK